MNHNHLDLSNPFFDGLKEVAKNVGIHLPDILGPIVAVEIGHRFGTKGLEIVGMAKYLYEMFRHKSDDELQPMSSDDIKKRLGWQSKTEVNGL